MSYASDLATSALARISGGDSGSPVNAITQRANTQDAAGISYDTQGASHVAYTKMLADQEAEKQAAAESAERLKQIQSNYDIANAWTKQQTANTVAQTAALNASGVTPASGAAAVAGAQSGPPSLWKSYQEYWTDKGLWDKASGYSGYHGSSKGDQTSPYRWNEEYNDVYLSSLPPGQQATARAGVGADWVRSGLTNKVLTGSGVIPIEGADYYWQNPEHQAEWTASQKAAAAAQVAAGPSSPPKRPTGKVSWQADAQYWKDLDAYNKKNKLGAYR